MQSVIDFKIFVLKKIFLLTELYRLKKFLSIDKEK